jgi:hypothetical protein
MCTYRALKLCSLAATAFHNVFHADFGIANVLFGSARSRTRCSIATAVAVETIVAVAVDLAAGSPVFH